MSERKVVGTVRVQLVVEVSVSGTWGPDCTVTQAHDQGLREAREKFNNLVTLDQFGKPSGCRVVDLKAVDVVMRREGA